MKDFKDFLKLIRVENKKIKELNIETLKSFNIEIIYSSIVEKQIFNNKKYLFIRFQNIENLEFQLNEYSLIFNPVYAFTFFNKGYLVICKNDGWERLNKFIVGKTKHLKRFINHIILSTALGINEINKENLDYKFSKYDINSFFINKEIKQDKVFDISYGDKIIKYQPKYTIKYIGNNDILLPSDNINDYETIPFYSFLYSFCQFMKLYPNITKKLNDNLYYLTNNDNFLGFDNYGNLSDYIKTKNYYQTMEQIIKSRELIKFIIDQKVNKELKENKKIVGGNNIIDMKQIKEDYDNNEDLFYDLQNYQEKNQQKDEDKDLSYRLNRIINDIYMYHQSNIPEIKNITNLEVNTVINDIIKQHDKKSYKANRGTYQFKDLPEEVNDKLTTKTISTSKINQKSLNEIINSVIKNHNEFVLDKIELSKYLNDKINDELVKHETVKSKSYNSSGYLNYLNDKINDELLDHATVENNKDLARYLNDMINKEIISHEMVKNNDSSKLAGYLNNLINDDLVKHKTLTENKIKTEKDNEKRELNRIINESIEKKLKKHKALDTIEINYNSSDSYHTPKENFTDIEEEYNKKTSSSDYYKSHDKTNKYSAGYDSDYYLSSDNEDKEYADDYLYNSNLESENQSINQEIERNLNNYRNEKYQSSRINYSQSSDSIHGGLEQQPQQRQFNNNGFKKPFNSFDRNNNFNFQNNNNSDRKDNYQENKDSFNKTYVSSVDNNIPEDVKNKVVNSAQPKQFQVNSSGVATSFNGVHSTLLGIPSNQTINMNNMLGQNAYYILDTIPDKFSSNRFNFGKVSDRMELISILNNAILGKTYDNGVSDINSLYSIINTFKIITMYPEFQKGNTEQKVNQDLIQFTNDYVSFSACYPYTIEHGQMRCAKTSVSLNVKIYSLLNYEDILKNVYDPIKHYVNEDREKIRNLLNKEDTTYKEIYDDVYRSKEYNLTRSKVFRELGFYNFNKKYLLNNSVCPHFPALIGKKLIDNDIFNSTRLIKNDIDLKWKGLNNEEKNKYVNIVDDTDERYKTVKNKIIETINKDIQEPQKENYGDDLKQFEKDKKEYEEAKKIKTRIIKVIATEFPKYYSANKEKISKIDFDNLDIDDDNNDNTKKYNEMLYEFARIYLKSFFTDQNNKYIFKNTVIQNQNKYSNKSLVALVENPGYSFNSWIQPEYKISGNTRIMINSGYRTPEEWESIIFQILYTFQCMIDNNIYIPNLSINNIFIKESKIDPTNYNYWIYEINNVKYYVPNYGFTVMFDVFHCDNFDNELLYDHETLNNKDLLNVEDKQNIEKIKEDKYDEYMSNFVNQ